MSNLRTIQVKDLGRIVTGHTPPTKRREFYGDEYTFIKPTDMQDSHRYVRATEERLSKEWYDLRMKTLLPPGASCVVTIGTIGKLCLIREPSFTNQATNGIVIDSAEFDELYVYYLMKHSIPKVKHLSSGTASGRENVSRSAFSGIAVNVHALPDQRKIGLILGSYDDLIENNRRIDQGVQWAD